MRELELLSPAKNLEQGIAAIDHGADAVYIGPPHFGARAAAGNSVADIARLCEYAHLFDVRVFATVNTLLHDDELPEAEQLICDLSDAQVDAILIQDMRLLQLKSLNSKLSALNLHASTQADNRTAEQLRWLYEQGVSRAVLARELSISEIAALHAAVPQMELEAFVHGALCVSYSGLCYASERCFGRSANRGECAQFCRMKFDLLDADGQELVHQRHLLSLKDLNLSHHLERLAEVGVTSFKIEGRLKDIAYVKNVTAAYSQLLDQLVSRHPDLYRRASRGHSRYNFTPDLCRTFNRGYTTYFADGRQPLQASFDTPKAIGQQVGRVKELRGPSFTVAGTASFTNGDGLCFFNDQRQLEGFRVNRVEGNRLFPQQMPASLRPGTTLFRSSDQAMERMLSRQSAERKIPVEMTLEAVGDADTDTGFLLTMSDGGHTTTARIAAEHQLAQTPQRENIVRQLSRLGGTPFECTAVQLRPADFPFFIPSSKLAELRRMVVESDRDARYEVRGARIDQNTEVADELNYSRTSHLAPRTSENVKPQAPLMQCRYCLRHELGCCVKRGGRQPQWREPLRLRLADGRRFRLEFDCRQCQMNVCADE